uniref:ATP synthase F0 subunit 8 n=1 Tax=Leptopilina myrica (nomen nudum) TaxID=2964900 RepID=A0AAU7BNF7_9HYME
MPQMKPMYWFIMLIYLIVLSVFFMILLSGVFLSFYFKKIKKEKVISGNWHVSW